MQILIELLDRAHKKQILKETLILGISKIKLKTAFGKFGHVDLSRVGR